MDELIEELQQVKRHQYRLSFNVPTDQELAKMRKIHRDKTDTEIARQKGAVRSLQELVAMAESGDLVVEAIPEDLRKRLGLLLESSDDAQ